MIKTKDGYGKLVGTAYKGSATDLLLSNGGIKAVSDFSPASRGIFYIEGTGSTNGTWLGSHTDITEYYKGLTIAYKIPIAGASTTTLNINSLGAKTCYIATSKLTTHYGVGTVVILVYDGTYFRAADYWNSNTYSDCACTTAAATAAKTATSTYYVLRKGNLFTCTIQNTNTAASALTLNINSTGAKAIYLNGSATSSTNYSLSAGKYLVYYDGTNYWFYSDGAKIPRVYGSAESLVVNNCRGTAGSESNSKAWDSTTIDDNKLKVWDVYDDGGPTTYGNILEINGRTNHWKPQIWFDSGTGLMRVRNRDYNSTTWNAWRVVLDGSNYTSYTVKKDGTGASGTWGINITGSAGSVPWTGVSGRPTKLSDFTNDSGFITIDHNHDSRYLQKVTYEWNKELALGSAHTGRVCIGKFPMYDSNIVINVNSTTNQSFHGTLVIATQNINTSGGGTKNCVVYGDATNEFTSRIRIKYVSGSNVFSVYCDFPRWSKNLVHIKAMALAGTPTDIVTAIDTIPSDATIIPTNALITNFAAKSHTHTKSEITDFSHNHDSDYLKKSGGLLNTGATLKFDTYGSRFLTISGNAISADMSADTGTWAGAFATVKSTKETTTMLGWYGSHSGGLTHIFMGGTYDQPAMKMTPAGVFTFANTIQGNISGSAGSVHWDNVTNKPTSFTPSSHSHTYIAALENYTFDSSALPNSFSLGASCGFVSSGSGFGNYGSVLTVRTYSGGGGTLQLYAPYSPTYGGTRLKARFGNYDSSNGNSWTGFNLIAWVTDIPTKVSLLENDAGYLTSLPSHNHHSDYMRVIEQNSTFTIDAIPSDLAPGVHKIHISGKEYSSILCGNDYTGAQWLLYFHPHASYDLAIKYRYRDGAWRTILDSTNSSVSKEGLTLTVTINGTSQSLTNSTYNFSGVSFTSGQSNTGSHDCDAIKTNGHWYYSSNGPTTALGASTTDGALYSQAYSTDWVAQIAQDYRNGNLYTRSHKGDGSDKGWKPWRKVAYIDDTIKNAYYMRTMESGTSNWYTGWKAWFKWIDGSTLGLKITNADTDDNTTASSYTFNADSATKLQTARTLTIGDTGKTFDGSGNVSWSLAEIGAATDDHNHDGTYLKKVTVANNVENDFNSFSNMTLTGRGDPTTGASLSNAPWADSGPAGGYGVLTYLWSGYGTQMAWGYSSNKIYIRNKVYTNGAATWRDTWDSIALTGEAQPASDVYAWAKAATKPSYAFSEITPGTATIGDGANSIYLRTSSSWASAIYHQTSADESVVFLNKGKEVNSTANYTTSWIFAYGNPSDRPVWSTLTPALQIKGACVAINKLIGSKVGGAYNLDVNGTANATLLYENGTRVSVSGHAHDDKYFKLTGGTITGTTTLSRPDGTVDALYYATRTDLNSGTSIGFGIGTSNNRGIYDAKAGGWILKVDTNNNVTFSGTAACADKVNVTTTSLKEVFYIPFVDAVSGSRIVNANSSLLYNPGTNTLTATTFNGNATSATKLATARTITLGTAVTATATSFNGTSNITIPVTKLYLGYLDWGGKSLAGEVSPIGCALSNEHNANRLAFLSSNAIDITTSSNGGSSYSAYSITAANKQQLVTTSSSVNIGPTTVAVTGRTRILLGANGTGTSFSQQYVYTSPKKLLLNITTNGHGVSVLIEYATGAAPTTYSTLGTYALSGWSGWNDIPLNGISRFGGSATQNTQVWYIRLTFMVTSVSASYANTPPLVLGIRMYGDNLWRAPSTMSQTGHLYSFDISQNATFPAKVNAASGFFQTSDESLKLVIRPITVDLDKLTQLRKVYFTWNELTEKKELLLGMIALDVQKLYPEIVNTDGDHLSLAYDKLSVVALKAIDELYKLIQDLLLENSKLKLLLNSLNN